MKRTERHRLKENEVASTVARAKETYERYHTSILAAGIGVLVVIVGVGIYVTWRSQTDSRSREMLADAMTVAQAKVDPAPVPGAAPAPKPAGGFPTEQARNEAALARFVALANEYPSTDAGLEALYHAAATLTALGRYGESVQRYQEVIAKAGTSVYGQMAKLGIADTEVASGKYDQAIATYRELATSSVGNLPVDGVLMQLAYAYQAAGKTSDARQAFKRILDEFPQSPYAADAKRAMGELKG
jgi:outer membrane protein assembly factor BamD (BamD/ComL family)